VVGVVVVVARVLTVRGLLGVAAGRVMVAVVGFEGVRPRRSKMPRTRPSLCGVGLIEVGAAPRGVRAVRSRDGVMAGWVADGVWAPDGMASAGGEWRVFCGVWAGLDLLDGVCGGRAASDWDRLRCGRPWVASARGSGGGGILPASVSRSLLYCLYLWAAFRVESVSLAIIHTNGELGSGR
jgi:hypothetical protein